MYIPNPGDNIMAMDAKTGDLIWEYKRKLPKASTAETNRNMAMWGNTDLDAGADNSIYARRRAHRQPRVGDTSAQGRSARQRELAGRSSPTAR